MSYYRLVCSDFAGKMELSIFNYEVSESGKKVKVKNISDEGLRGIEKINCWSNLVDIIKLEVESPFLRVEYGVKIHDVDLQLGYHASITRIHIQLDVVGVDYFWGNPDINLFAQYVIAGQFNCFY